MCRISHTTATAVFLLNEQQHTNFFVESLRGEILAHILPTSRTVLVMQTEAIFAESPNACSSDDFGKRAVTDG